MDITSSRCFICSLNRSQQFQILKDFTCLRNTRTGLEVERLKLNKVTGKRCPPQPKCFIFVNVISKDTEKISSSRKSAFSLLRRRKVHQKFLSTKQKTETSLHQKQLIEEIQLWIFTWIFMCRSLVICDIIYKERVRNHFNTEEKGIETGGNYTQYLRRTLHWRCSATFE